LLKVLLVLAAHIEAFFTVPEPQSKDLANRPNFGDDLQNMISWN
jgi:hypothetical protein